MTGGFAVFRTRVSFLFLFAFLVAVGSARAEETVGLYVGSFDPVTEGHKAAVADALAVREVVDPATGKTHNVQLSKVYVMVNYDTAKDFNASMDERVRMAKEAYAEFGDRVVVLREPIEGRPAFAKYLVEKYGQVWGMFGDDTYEKNRKIFDAIENFHFFQYKRPEPAVGLEAMQITVPRELDVDGVSSSAARKIINEGGDSTGLLAPKVREIIDNEKLYLDIPAEKLPAAKADFLARYRKYLVDLKRVSPDLDLTGLPEPEFKATQSVAGQTDKFVLHVAKFKKMTPPEQIAFRQLSETILPIRYPTLPLRSPKKAGFYAGSFDPPSNGQKAVIAELLKQGNEVVYVSVLGKSPRKPLTGGLDDRLEMARAMTAEFGDRVVVISAPDIESTADSIRRLQNEHSAPMTAAFGENVFQANYDRLRAIKGLENLQFAFVPFTEAVPASLPANTQVMRVAAASDTSLPKEVREIIARRDTYPVIDVGPRNPNPQPRTPCGSTLTKILTGGTLPIEL